MTSVRLEPTSTRAAVQAAATAAAVELIDIYTTYYWLYPGQIMPEHREVTANDGDD